MAFQRADNDENDRPRRPWWGGRGAPHAAPEGAPHAGSPGLGHAVSPAVNHAVGHAVNHAASPGNSPGGSPGASHAASHAASHGDAPWRFGDHIVHPDVDGSPEPSAEEYARAFIGFLQKHPALQELLDGWISSRALWRKY